MRLADFIRANRETIVSEWECFARSLLPAGSTSSTAALRDHADAILDAAVADMKAQASDKRKAERSRAHEGGLAGAGGTHAVLRLEEGFKLDQLVAEYRSLRSSVLRLWAESGHERDLEGVIRFNEAIDEALAVATTRYIETVEHHRDLFLGVLGHDLRNPLGAIIMGASMLASSEAIDDKNARIAARVLNSARRMERMVRDLLDLTRTRLGAGIPIVRAPVDLGPICGQVMAELRGGHPDDSLVLETKGDLRGEWDGDRLAEVLSNVVGNAIEHGTKNGSVTVVARAHGDAVVVEIHNLGPPIPRNTLRTMFEPMVRHDRDGGRSANLGLGLYIADQVVRAHGGKITVTSSKATGTTFTIHLPRSAPVRRDELVPAGGVCESPALTSPQRSDRGIRALAQPENRLRHRSPPTSR